MKDNTKTNIQRNRKKSVEYLATCRKAKRICMPCVAVVYLVVFNSSIGRWG